MYAVFVECHLKHAAQELNTQEMTAPLVKSAMSGYCHRCVLCIIVEFDKCDVFSCCLTICILPLACIVAVWGKCKHAFHMQCIMKWLESQQNVKQDCPMCRQEWKFREE
jgi:hypothetical protein